MKGPEAAPRQLAFDLPARHHAQGRGDFFVSSANRLALAQIEAWESWPNRKLVLTGPPGAGKSHLARVWAGLADALVVSVEELVRRDVELLAGQNICIEDGERSAGQPRAEQALFHLHNLAQAEGAHLLLTATRPPARWNLTLPDLASRLEASALAALDPPDDALLAAVLVKLFGDRQIAVKPTLIAYLVPRMERSLAAAAALVERLDKAALAAGRPVGRTLAAGVLAETSPEGD